MDVSRLILRIRRGRKDQKRKKEVQKGNKLNDRAQLIVSCTTSSLDSLFILTCKTHKAYHTCCNQFCLQFGQLVYFLFLVNNSILVQIHSFNVIYRNSQNSLQLSGFFYLSSCIFYMVLEHKLSMASNSDPSSSSSSPQLLLSPMEDPQSPFFLQHGETPGAILVSQLLTEDNYPTWARAMKMALDTKSKLGFVDGSINASMAITPLEKQARLKCNSMISSWILNLVFYRDTAFGVWNALKNWFSQANGSRISQLQKQIVTVMQGKEIQQRQTFSQVSKPNGINC